MPKLLIICDVYPPSFAPRMGYLVKYIKEWNWTADIVTRGTDGDYSFQSLLGSEKVIRVNGVPIPMKTAKDKVARLVSQKQTHKKNAKLIAKKVLNILNPDDYKLILCSTAHRTFLLDAAWQVAKTWKIPWIADIRDLNEQLAKTEQLKTGLWNYVFSFFNSSYKEFALKKRNLRFISANTIITISPWHVDQIKKYNINTKLIYNGFAPELYFPKGVCKIKTFNITYTGTVHAGIQNPELLFQAIKKLKDNNIISKTNFRIQFYVPKNWRKNVINYETYTPIKEFVHFYDYVDTSEVPQLLKESSILLLLTNVFKKDGPKGIMTTKYFEYLAMERPVLCVRSDENILEESIKKAKAGISARSVEEAYDFILEKWMEWKEKGYTTIHMNKEYTQQFSRKLQAKQFVELFEEVIK